MKRFILIISLTLLANSVGWSARIITSFDIARWYLDSDLVIVCSVNNIDTLSLGCYDSLYADNERIRYNIIQESYYVTVDSIIRNGEKEKKTTDKILSQRFRINYSHTKELEKKFDYVDSKGDSIFSCMVEMYMDDCSDNSYFRLGLGKKYVVILSETSAGFVIDYESEYNESFMKMISEIELKGESYFILQQEE